MQKDIKAKLFENPLNKMCFDCSTKDPEWVSVNNAVFLCKECQLKHRSYGISVSYIRSLEMDLWKEDQIALLKYGGNERLRDLMSLYNVKFNTNREELYNSKLLDYYRKLLKSDLKGEVRPQPPSDEEALFPCEKQDKFYENNSLSNSSNVNSNPNSLDQEYSIDKEVSKNEEKSSNSGYTGYLYGFVGGVWNTTKDVAAQVKNKADESGLTEKIKSKTSYVAEKLKEGTQTVVNKGKELGAKGYEYTVNKYEDVVRNYLFYIIYFFKFNYRKVKELRK
jgi:hypothetical protein